jgi:uncharacterized membrane-anchored protein
MKFDSSFKTLASVIIPLIILLAWWLRIAMVVGGGDVVGFGVTGYDPRDLLSGHYLTYRVQYAPAEPCLNSPEGTELCLCFGTESNETTWQGSCQELPANGCRRFLRGRCDNYRFQAGIERYYIPETYASSNAIPADSYILVSLDGQGSGVVKDFMVGKQRLIDWLRENANKKLLSPTP